MMNQKKTVLFVTQGETGGAERITANIARFLDRDRYSVLFVAVCPKLKEIQSIIPEGDDLMHIRIRNVWDFTTFRLIKMMKRLRPDYVFCSAMYLNPRVIWAARYVGGIKIIVRNCNTMKNLRWDKKLLIRLTYPLADIIVAQQEEMGEEISSLFPQCKDRVRVMHNPLDTASIDKGVQAPNPYKDDSTIKFINVARVCPVKGQDILLDAFEQVHRENPATSLYLVGRTNDNPGYYQQLQGSVQAKGLMHAVHFVGHDANPYRWLKYADCFVLASRNEGLPNCLLEAMYVGLPVVAARCIPIIGRIVNEGVNGYTVPTEDPEAMAAAMQKATTLNGGMGSYRPATEEDFRKLFE